MMINQDDDSDLRRLIAPAQGAKALAEVLRDPEIGGFEVKTLLDKPSYKVDEEIQSFFNDRERDDLSLVYFSCHGIKDEEGQLYFATTNTSRRLSDATAISANFVNRMMFRSRSKRQLLLIDCCYSGAFAKGLVSRADKKINTGSYFEEGRGRIVLTASDSMQYSFEEDRLSLEVKDAGSIFTRAIVDGLNTGKADLDKDGHVSYEELYEYTFDRVINETPLQKPGKWVFGVEGDIIIANTPTKRNENSEREQQQLILKLLEEEKIEEFNKMRKANDIPLYFQKANLNKRDLRGADLHNVDFADAKLVNAKLRMANLNGANLRGADLTEAELRGADLYRADLSRANLTGADHRSAELKGMIDFTGANLTKADLRSADLKGIINFDGTILHDVDFTGARLDRRLVSFKGAKIHNVIGLPDDLFEINRYIKNLKAFSKVLEEYLNINNVGPEQIKPIEESVKELGKEVDGINEDDEKHLSDIQKQNIKTKFVAVIEKLMKTLPQTSDTIAIFSALSPFSSVMGEEY